MHGKYFGCTFEVSQRSDITKTQNKIIVENQIEQQKEKLTVARDRAYASWKSNQEDEALTENYNQAQSDLDEFDDRTEQEKKSDEENRKTRGR